MAAPFVGLALKVIPTQAFETFLFILYHTAANPAIEHYDKVYEPARDRAKDGVRKVREKITSPTKDRFPESDDDDYYDRPRRRDTHRDSGRSRGRDDYVEESYERKVTGGRAKSVGRDGRYGGGGRGLDRDSRRSRRHYSSSDSESSPEPLNRKHRKSLGEQALALLGVGGGAAAVEHERDKDRDRRRDSDRRRDKSRGGYSRDDRDDYRRDDYRRDDRSRGGRNDGGNQDGRNRYVPAGYLRNGDDNNSANGGDGTVATRNQNQVASRSQSKGGDEEKRGEKRSSESSSDASCSSTEDERRTKKMRGKEFLTAGLAAVATIHAAQGVYKSMEARDKRHEEVAKGEITEQEAAKKKNKARLQDAAAIGIAALGIKGAYSEWKEVQEHREELAEQKKERQKRHEKRMRKAEKMSHQGGGGGGYGRGNSGGYRQSEPDLNRRYRD